MDLERIQHLTAIGELLFGAAHADGKLAGSEVDRVYGILSKMVEEHEVLSMVSAHLEDFDADNLNIPALCKRLADSPEVHRELLEALAEITDADGVQDLAESRYIRQVAQCLGMEADQWRHLAFEIVNSRSSERPPPLPGHDPSGQGE